MRSLHLLYGEGAGSQHVHGGTIPSTTHKYELSTNTGGEWPASGARLAHIFTPVLSETQLTKLQIRDLRLSVRYVTPCGSILPAERHGVKTL
jgi:hypothetical protein